MLVLILERHAYFFKGKFNFEKEAYSEPCQTSKMENSAIEIYRLLIFVSSPIQPDF